MRLLQRATKNKWPYLLLFLAGLLFSFLGFASQYSLELEQLRARDLSEELIRGAFSHLQGVVTGFGILMMLAAPLLYLFRAQLSKALDRFLRTDGDFYAEKGIKRKATDLFLISFAGLFFEMLVIRWLAAEFRLFAYLKNPPLLASFMGLGIGLALVRRRENLFPLTVPLRKMSVLQEKGSGVQI